MSEQLQNSNFDPERAHNFVARKLAELAVKDSEEA